MAERKATARAKTNAKVEERDGKVAEKWRRRGILGRR
jgi:hypothetical protein